jgi:tetratricopeptide (TPR) repeat protein
MKVSRVSFAFVSAAFLAAFATSCGASYASSPEANIALVRKAYTTLQSGDAKTAVGEYSDAIASDQLEPEMLANALLNRALAYQQMGDPGLALVDYDAAIALQVMAPSLRATAHYNRGLAHQKLANSSKAIEDFTSALLINPKFSQAYFSRGNALRDSGQLLFALSDYERAMRYGHPDRARVHFGSATTYLALKRPLDAKRELNEALNINPQFGQARAQLVLLGDENAQLPASDPILTGSVGVFGGGTVAKKPSLPAAVSPPAVLEQVVAGTAKPKGKTPGKVKKDFTDRVPMADEADTEIVASIEPADPVSLEAVPDIPAPVTKKVAAAAEPVAPKPKVVAQGTEEINSEPANQGAWAVQIASAGSEDAAWATWKKMQARFKVLKNKDALVVKADLGSKGVFYRVRLGGFDEQTAAKAACGKLKAGGVDCYISKAGG